MKNNFIHLRALMRKTQNQETSEITGMAVSQTLAIELKGGRQMAPTIGVW